MKKHLTMKIFLEKSNEKIKDFNKSLKIPHGENNSDSSLEAKNF